MVFFRLKCLSDYLINAQMIEAEIALALESRQ